MKIKAKNLPGRLLKKQLKHLQANNSRISLRSCARKLKISVPFLSRVLQDQTNFPVKRFKDFCRVFQVDDQGREFLIEAITSAILNRELFSYLPTRKLNPEKNISAMPNDEEYELVPASDFELLSKWYILPILDLTTCENFVFDCAAIARRLNLREELVSEVIRILLKKKYLSFHNGSLKKTQKLLRFPAAKSLGIVRDFHVQMLRKTERVLNDPQEDYDRRLVNGIVFAANPERLEEAKGILSKAIYDIAGLMTEGNCLEVYYSGGILVPLTKNLQFC